MTEEEQNSIELTKAAGTHPPVNFDSGRYVVQRILGEGGQKIVYLVHDEALDRECALSMIKSELLDAEDLERLRREAQAMARLGAHSNIVTVHDVGEEDGRPYLVCEYVPGGDLRQELRSAGGSLPLERALAIAADIARALAVAHARGVIHRDLKPANVWLCEDGSAKLGDFGLAFSLDRSRLTMAGTVMGTAAYMSPEQALGAPVTERSDLYSLGALLYEMVCGRPPFADENVTALIAQHINARPAPPSQHNPHLPAALDGLILRLLAKAPEERPPSAAAVGVELSAIKGAPANGDSATVPAATAPSPKPKAAGRRRFAIGAALVGVAAAAVALGLFFALRDSGGDDKAAVIPGTTLVAEGYVPRLEPRDCPAELTSDPAVLCHDLVVPEDRSKPAGRQVRILVMVAPSKAQPAGIPTVFIGDRFGTIYSTEGVLKQPAGSDVRDYGDVVAFGVRGQQLSQPRLDCPELGSVWRDWLALPENGPAANKLWLDAAEQCGRRLVTEGLDLNSYGQDEIVKDVRDLAIAKGWRQINVQGSYDLSRVAVLLAARYPGLVRSVVLADPFPVDATWYDDRLSNVNSSLQAYYAACRADPACEQAFPNLEQALPAIYAELQQDLPLVPAPDPAGGPDISVLLNGDRALGITTLALAFQDILPSSAASWVSAEKESVARSAAAYVVLTSAPDPSRDRLGASFSAYCEDVDQHVVRGALAGAEALYPLWRVFAHDPLFELCPRWPTQARSRAIGPLETTSAVPALIFTGALNPFAPPAYAQRAAKSFTHATVAVFPSLTAQVLTDGPPCVSALRLAFLRDPGANLDVEGCIAKVPPIAFEGTGSAGTTPAAPTSGAR